MKVRAADGSVVDVLGVGKKQGNLLVMTEGASQPFEMGAASIDEALLPGLREFTVIRMVYKRACCKRSKNVAKMQYHHELEEVRFTFRAVGGAEASVLADASKFNREVDMRHHQVAAGLHTACWMPSGGY